MTLDAFTRDADGDARDAARLARDAARLARVARGRKALAIRVVSGHAEHGDDQAAG